MSTSPTALVIVCCTESHPNTILDPASHMNTTSQPTTILKTAGARVTDQTIRAIYDANQATPLRMIIVLGHAACPYASGDVDGTVRSSVQALRASQYLRKDISVMGSVLDLVAVQTANGPASTAKMREVYVPNPSTSVASASASSQQQTSNRDLGPYWG